LGKGFEVEVVVREGGEGGKTPDENKSGECSSKEEAAVGEEYRGGFVSGTGLRHRRIDAIVVVVMMMIREVRCYHFSEAWKLETVSAYVFVVGYRRILATLLLLVTIKLAEFVTGSKRVTHTIGF